MLPRVSIVVTNYNYGRFLGAAIESALGQTHTDCEVIVVDDGSTDDSLAVIERYPEVVAIAQPNRGQAGAFNAGFERAGGDVVIFLDADDMLASETAQMVAEAYSRSPNVAKVMYRLRVMDEAGLPTGELKPEAHLPLRSGDLRPYMLRFPLDTTWMATSGNAFRSSALARIFPVPEPEYPVCADFYLSLLTPLLGEVVFLDRVGGSYRVHASNSYERAAGVFDLEKIRQTIVYSEPTLRHVVNLARELELPDRPLQVDDALSVSQIYERLVSLRLDPGRHPLPTDTRLGLLRHGLRASRRRFDVAPPLRLLLAAWITGIALVPRAALPRLLRAVDAVRGSSWLGTLLSRLHRG